MFLVDIDRPNSDPFAGLEPFVDFTDPCQTIFVELGRLIVRCKNLGRLD